jgi:hypothetical protein
MSGVHLVSNALNAMRRGYSVDSVMLNGPGAELGGRAAFISRLLHFCSFFLFFFS